MKILPALIKRFVPPWRRPVFTPSYDTMAQREETVKAIRHDLSSPQDTRVTIAPPTQACHKCGGIFREEKLTSVFQIEISSSGQDAPVVTTTYFCMSCQPVVPLVINLKTDDGDLLDKLHLNLGDGWFQQVDAASGEDMCPISLDEHASLYCNDCGELSNPDQKSCAACRREEKKS
ncbi:hypothetical protein LCGC14_0294460 [marine sediment metagenome]|uniref:Uncharacterized protein n=1 Tax=marine sediment metagenome TaxID=412755 RepID=A0A0F9WXS0_9ZZZZ